MANLNLSHRNPLKSILLVSLAALFILGSTCLFSCENTPAGGNAGGENGENEPSKTPDPIVIETEPLPESTFVKKGVYGGFEYDLYEDYVTITRGDNSLSAPEIPETIEDTPVMSIGDSAFSSCTLLESVKLPEGLRHIGKYAFLSCTLLSEVKIPESVHEIEESAFASCSSLSKVEIFSGVKTLGVHAFADTPFLEEHKDEFVIVGDGILIGYHGDISAITIPSDVKKIASLSSCEILTSVYIPQGVTEIGDFAFAGCTNLSTILIPDSIKAIGKNAFTGCAMLTGVRLEEGVTSLGERAFSGCDNLKSVGLPASLTFIGEYLFEDTTTLETIYVAPNSFAEEHFKGTEYASLVIAEEA